MIFFLGMTFRVDSTDTINTIHPLMGLGEGTAGIFTTFYPG